MVTSSDRVTLAEAARLLGVSHSKVWRLVRDGRLVAHRNPLDQREKLVRREDVERLRSHSATAPRFISDGADDDPVEVPASRIKDWVRETWHAGER